MKILGIIAEYNPFHNGHLYHINKAKKIINPDITICVMSSSFTMRGDISIVDKFTKSKEALLSGIDIIVELPFIFTASNADIFSKKAVDILNYLNVTDIVIGSESNDITSIISAYNAWNDDTNQAKIKSLLNLGYSYKYATNSVISLPSNDLLGFSYYKAIKDNNYNINLLTIKREDNNYLDENLAPNGFSSAKAIRANLDKVNDFTPSFSFMKDYIYLNFNDLYPLFQYKMLIQSLDSLKNYYLVDEGIEALFLKNINKNFEDFLNSTTSKRYTSSRIKRTIISILFSINKEDQLNYLNKEIDHVRVLGYTNNGKSYISSIKKSKIIYTNIKDGINYSFDCELKITKILDVIYKKDLLSKEQGAPIFIDKEKSLEIIRF